MVLLGPRDGDTCYLEGHGDLVIMERRMETYMYIYIYYTYMGGGQNYGPFLDPYYNMAPYI